MKFVRVRQECIGEDGIEVKGDGGDSVEVICNDQNSLPWGRKDAAYSNELVFFRATRYAKYIL